MNTGVMSGLLLAFVNGAICITLPLILSKVAGKKSQKVAKVAKQRPLPTVEPEIVPQKI